MRMPSHHLGVDRLNDIIKCEGAFFGRHLGVVDNLQQQISQFFAEVLSVPTRDRVSHLVGLFNGVGHYSLKTLLKVPWAACGGRA